MYKRREHILAAVTAIFLAMCLCLLGCGGSGGNNSPQMSSAQAAPSAEPAAPAPEESYDYDYGKDTSQIVIDGSDGEAGGAPQFDLPDTRKVIRHANMELETKEFDPALSGILQAVANAGGYIESQDQGGGSSYGSGRYRERYASINARVPSAKLDEVIRSVGGLCNVVTQSQSMDDITDRYYDAEAHLTTLRVQEERLLEILSKAEKLEDIITLESALSDVRYQIESLTASLRRMDSQVTYSFLNLSLQEVVEYQVMQEKPRTFGERMKEAYGDGIDDLRRTLRDAVDTDALYHGGTVISNSRHYEALTSASEALSAALDGLRDNLPTDLLSEEIRQVIHHLSGVTGQDIVPEEVLKTIFSKFCIGK